MREQCLMQTCGNGASRGFCNYHWRRMPADLRERFLFVRREGTDIEYAAALRACEEEASGEAE